MFVVYENILPKVQKDIFWVFAEKIKCLLSLNLFVMKYHNLLQSN